MITNTDLMIMTGFIASVIYDVSDRNFGKWAMLGVSAILIVERFFK
jgi:hypothetical protein